MEEPGTLDELIEDIEDIEDDGIVGEVLGFVDGAVDGAVDDLAGTDDSEAGSMRDELDIVADELMELLAEAAELELGGELEELEEPIG